MKKLTILLTVIFAVMLVPTGLEAFSLKADNHTFNPALLGTSSRSLLEVGVSASVGLDNNYFSVMDFLSSDPEPVLVIDLDDLYDAVKIDGLQLKPQVFTEAHAKLRIWNISFGAYATVDGVIDTALPPELFKFLAQGNEIGESIEGTGLIDAKSFLEAGVYLGYRWNYYQLGFKVGQYMPLLVSENLKYDFYLETQEAEDPEDLVAKGWVEVSGKVYSTLNLEDPESALDDPMMLREYAGLKVDAGVVYAKQQGKPLWGASVSVPVKPALAPYTFEAVGRVDIEVTNPLGSITFDDDNGGNGDGDDEGGPDFIEVVEDPEFDFILVDGAPVKEIMLPMRAGAFYRLTLIPLIDLIPHVELVFDEPMVVNGGLTVTGSFFPLNWISVGLDYRNASWSGTAALDMNLWMAELGVRVSSSAAQLADLKKIPNPKVSVHAAVGF